MVDKTNDGIITSTMKISPKDLLRFPLHDAVLIHVRIEPSESGSLDATIAMEINFEESMDVFGEFGIKNRSLMLVFQRCWQVKCTMHGNASAIESISTWGINNESDLIKQCSTYQAFRDRLTHFSLTGSKGSQWDLVGESISIVEFKPTSA